MNPRMKMSDHCKHAQHSKCDSEECWCACHPIEGREDRGPHDYACACEMTPSGYNVTSWMDEMDAQHTTMTACMRELLAELKRCHEDGTAFDFLSDVVTRAYDTVGVIRVTPADLGLIAGHDAHGEDPAS